MAKSQKSKTKMKHLKGKGKIDYDYKYDILFFKTMGREYVKSIEIDNMALDIDKDGFIVGIQIFEASKFLKTYKYALLKVSQWGFEATVEDGRIEFRLTFNVVIRNKVIEKNPIMLDAKIMMTHYSAKLLFSNEARAEFIEPDIAPIPRYGGLEPSE